MLADWIAADGCEPVRAPSLRSAIDEMQARTFDLLVADYGLAFRGGLHALSRGRTRNAQTPAVIVGPADESSRTQAEHHNAMYVERPVERSALICLVAMIIMEHRPVRRSVRKPVPRLEAIVDGVTSRLLDVSNEGLRLEIPRGRRASPPFFNVKIPLIGVGLTVQRIWTSLPAGVSSSYVGFCGGALADNPARASQAWRTFVDALPLGGGLGAGIFHVQ
jgi:CheY-like chemotaxis protein